MHEGVIGAKPRALLEGVQVGRELAHVFAANEIEDVGWFGPRIRFVIHDDAATVLEGQERVDPAFHGLTVGIPPRHRNLGAGGVPRELTRDPGVPSLAGLNDDLGRDLRFEQRICAEPSFGDPPGEGELALAR